MTAMKYDARSRYLARRDAGRRKEILTPEGIPITFIVAPAGDRIVGYLTDVVLMGLIGTVLVVLGMLAVGWELQHSWIGAFMLLALFLLRTFWFPFFELRWQGQTPGKRQAGIRVIDRRGGPLRAEALFVRNVMREIEVYVPMTALANPDLLWPGAPGWARLGALVWLLVFALMPLFNHDRLRIGDLVAGTLVVIAPRPVLLDDVAAAAAVPKQDAVTFTSDQLDVYGIYELQVLEDLLREDGRKDRLEALTVVCEKVQRKIGWTPPDGARGVDPLVFLQAFYAAQRARLEHKLLFGKRQERKRGG